MPEPEDQAQNAGAGEPTATPDDGNQGQQGDNPTANEGRAQSNNEGEPSNQDEAPKYKTPDGRELSGDELAQEYKKLQSEFTRRSQENAKYKEKYGDLNAQQGNNQGNPTNDMKTAMEQDEMLKNVDPSVKEVLARMTTPLVEQKVSEVLQQHEQEAKQKEADQKFEQKLQDLEKQYPGNNGLPKFDREAVLEAMKDEENLIFDPEAKFAEMNKEQFNDFLVKEAMRKRGVTVETEDTGGQSGSGENRQPDRKTPKTLAEAANSALSRLRQSE